MKEAFFTYKGVSLNRSEFIKLIQKVFESCLGFAPSARSFKHFLPFPYHDSVVADFSVNCTNYRLSLSLVKDSSLELLNDTLNFPCLGYIGSWQLADFLDDILKSRLDKNNPSD